MTLMRTSAEETGYGIGRELRRDERGYRTVGQGGRLVGGMSSLLVHPAHSVVVAVQVKLTNGDSEISPPGWYGSSSMQQEEANNDNKMSGGSWSRDRSGVCS